MTKLEPFILAYGISPEQLMEISAFLMSMALKTHQQLTRLTINLLLHDFSKKWNLLDMWGYLKWASSTTPEWIGREEPASASEIFATIVHDLNGRNDPGFLPRTDGYHIIYIESLNPPELPGITKE